jgi:hypothetical protein
MSKFILAMLIGAVAWAGPSSNRYVTGQFIKNGSGIFAIPSVSTNDQLVGRATTDTLTNKTIDTGSNTITNLGSANLGGTLSSGNIIVGNGSNQSAAVAVTGDVLLSNAGVTSYNNVVPIAKGGTNNGSLAVTNGGVAVTDGSKVINSGAGTTGQVLLAGTPAAFGSLTGPSATYLTSTSTTAGYWFAISSGNATVGATYTNNSNTYIVISTVSSATTVLMSGTGAPLSSGTLTKSGGTGDATLTFSAATAMAGYTPPTGTKTLDVIAVGGGGGGAGTDSVASSTGTGVGGQGGSTVLKTITSPDAIYYYAIGAGGAGGVSGNNSGSDGAQTVFGSANLTLLATGGYHGIAFGSQTSFPACQSATSSAVAPTGGDLNFQGTVGGQACVFSSTIVPLRGTGGSSMLGGGGSNCGGNHTGCSGLNYGGGGSAGIEVNNSGAVAGGPGAGGVIIIKAYIQ